MDINRKIYVIDVAFHKYNLNYKDNDNDKGNEDLKGNAKRITKKILKAAFCLCGYFNRMDGEIIFATPKISPKSLKETKEVIEKIREFFKCTNFRFNIDLIYKERFYNEIFRPVIGKAKENSDTAELFMRAYDLHNLCEQYAPSLPITPQKKDQITHRKCL